MDNSSEGFQGGQKAAFIGVFEFVVPDMKKRDLKREFVHGVDADFFGAGF